jgi:hypothetical protein
MTAYRRSTLNWHQQGFSLGAPPRHYNNTHCCPTLLFTGNVHYFERVTNVTDVFTVYLDGFADADVINYVLYGKPYTPRELLLFSGLYGIPTDMTGAFVKGFNDSTGEKQLYRNARGPIDVPDAGAAVRRLQQLFDYVEKYNCCKACL